MTKYISATATYGHSTTLHMIWDSLELVPNTVE